MYCEKCGHEMKNGRCPNCGFPVGEPQWEEQKSKKKSGKKIGIIILSVVIVLIFAAAILAAIFWLKKENTQKKFDTHIEKGQKYLEEMDYEKAADNYLAAIDIDPKAEDPYMKLADLYLEIDQPENAAIVLKKGVKNTGSRAMKNRYDLYTYVDQNLIPEEGQCEEGEYECDYYEGTGYTGSVSLNTITNGRIFGSDYLSLKAGKFGLSANYNCDRDNTPWNDASSMREDLNNKEEQDGGPYQNGIYLRMYESEKNEIVLKDEYKALYPVIGAGDEEDDGIFLKKHGGNIYLCGSSYAIADIYADGATISSFILTYEEGAFVQQAGTEERISGSEFYWYSGYWDMAMMMDELDMTEDAAQVRRDHMPRFQSWDEADEMLVRITGENKGYKELLYEETGEIKYLGHVEVLVQLSGF